MLNIGRIRFPKNPTNAQFRIPNSHLRDAGGVLGYYRGYAKNAYPLATFPAPLRGASDPSFPSHGVHLEKMRKYLSGKRSIASTLFNPAAFIQPVTCASETI